MKIDAGRFVKNIFYKGQECLFHEEFFDRVSF